MNGVQTPVQEDDERGENLEAKIAAMRKQAADDSFRNYRRFTPKPRRTSRTGKRR